jgi:hypothetical protein
MWLTSWAMQGEPARQTKPITPSKSPPAKRQNPHPVSRKAQHPALIAIACLLARQAAQEWLIREAGSDPEPASIRT